MRMVYQSPSREKMIKQPLISLQLRNGRPVHQTSLDFPIREPESMVPQMLRTQPRCGALKEI